MSNLSQKKKTLNLSASAAQLFLKWKYQKIQNTEDSKANSEQMIEWHLFFLPDEFYKDEVHIAFASSITYRNIYNHLSVLSSDFGTPFKSRKIIIYWNVNKL